MSDIMGILAVILAIACMILSQRKSTENRSAYAFLGSIASIMIAVEASHRNELGVLVLFAGAAAFSLIGVAADYLKPTKPDA
jgi:drug/metabolite transporter (DMT)-like permease